MKSTEGEKLIQAVKRSKCLEVIFPSSAFDLKDENAKLLEVYYITRALLTFRVTRLLLYGKANRKIIKVMEYLLKQPYLKKEVKIDNDLKMVGILPPLNASWHSYFKEPVEGDIREVSKGNCGLGRIKYVGKRETKWAIVLDSNRRILAYLDSNPFYHGFEIIVVNSLGEAMKLNKGFPIIASRTGKEIWEVKGLILEKYINSGISLIIGEREGLNLLDLKEGEAVKFVSNQGVKTIRSEEALLYSLPIISSIIDSRQ